MTPRKLGIRLMIVSVVTRLGVLLLLLFLSWLPTYINFKIGYNSARLVELSDGKLIGLLYRITDFFYSLFPNPVSVAQSSGGMTWSIRVFGVPFTDPIAFLSVLVKHHSLALGFALGVVIPVLIAFLLGRVFCAYICPASLVFFVTSRVRNFLLKYLYLPNFSLPRSFAYGILVSGLVLAIWIGHSVWGFLLPYLTVGKSIFMGMTAGVLSFSMISFVLFILLDVFAGKQFTCRYVCPTGRLLGDIGRKSRVQIQRNKNACIQKCHACEEVCPMGIRPKQDETVDCSLCGECMVICPTECLDIKVLLLGKETS